MFNLKKKKKKKKIELNKVLLKNKYMYNFTIYLNL